MFSIDEYVLNQKTGHIGKVVGYGHQILNNVYMTTLKVLVSEAGNPLKHIIVEEDLYSAWVKWFNS